MAGMGCAGIAGGIFLYSHDPTTTQWMPVCVFHEITGMYCPGCGSGRSVYALLHGDFLQAMRMNVLLYPMLLFAGLILWKPEIGKNSKVIWSVFFILITYWVLRNIPFFPWNYL